MNTYGNFGKVCDFPERKPTVNILVVGAPQVGKSSFINAHRTAVTNSNKWPTAPVGICGFYGTTTVEPFPDNPTNPSWLFIDTPGRFYDSADEPVLHLLMEGMPWRTKLAGSNALSVEEIAEVIPIPTNKANQAVIVVPANDLIEDLGWSNTLFFRNRFTTASDAESVILYCKGLVSKLRALLQDQSPFIVISKMDKVGGAGNAQARNEILSLMGQCVPVNRVYFTACPDGQSAVASRRSLTLDPATRENLLQLHEDICFSVQWRNKVTDL
ncbi:hypothetical protein AGDE_06029 [Angomonas deanei]|nr:hypothetical protein AGDE_06029 [Angomonas deanei]|eukprot:EPY37904.1 hypothetical protein AGDE_06029 [Angomonas deanei]